MVAVKRFHCICVFIFTWYNLNPSGNWSSSKGSRFDCISQRRCIYWFCLSKKCHCKHVPATQKNMQYHVSGTKFDEFTVLATWSPYKILLVAQNKDMRGQRSTYRSYWPSYDGWHSTIPRCTCTQTWQSPHLVILVESE